MTKTEIQNELKELEKKLNELREKLNKPANKVWKPEYENTYYYITVYGIARETVCINGKFDECTWATGNCFKTKEEAEFEAERLKVISELKRFAEEHNDPIDWEDTLQNKWFIGAYTAKNTIGCSFVSSFKSNDIYFSSREIAQQAISEIGEERIKKYYLGV